MPICDNCKDEVQELEKCDDVPGLGVRMLCEGCESCRFDHLDDMAELEEEAFWERQRLGI